MTTASTASPGWHRRLHYDIPGQQELYEKLKAYQWNATDEIDWSTPIRNFSEPAYEAVKNDFTREEFDRICAERRAYTFTQLFVGEQAALGLCAQLVNMVPELDTKLCLSGQIIDEARHVEVFGRYIDKLGVEAPINPPLEELIHRLLETDHVGEKIIGMQIFLEGIAVGIFQSFQTQSPDPFLREIIGRVLRDESRHSGFGVIYLGDRFSKVSAAERRKLEDFSSELFRLFGATMGMPFGGDGGFLRDTFTDIRRRLGQIGLETR